MNRLGKRISAVVLSITLVIGMCSTCLAASWGSYFGADKGWAEGASGKMTKNTATAWTVNLATLGWGGAWGGQVYLDNSKSDNAKGISVKKGSTYTLKCTLKSSNCDKWVLIKVATGDNYAFGKWIQVKRGATTTVNEKFTAKCNANSIYFGIGGDMGDRIGVTTDPDAAYRYSLSKVAINDIDPTFSTTISMANYSLTSKVKAVSNKKTNIKNLVKYLKSNGKVYVKKSGYKCTVKASGSAVSLKVVKGKTLINAKVKTSNYKKVFKKIKKNKKAKKAATKLSAVLKAQTGLTLKNIGY